MRNILISGAAAIALAAALPAAAQTTGAATTTKTPAAPPAADATMPPATTGSAATTAAPTAPAGTAADTSASAATLAVGLSVKDNTGATIGQVTQLKPDASGKNVATIKMGADTFAVDAANLAVQDGAAVINATQAELQTMIKASKPQKQGG